MLEVCDAQAGVPVLHVKDGVRVRLTVLIFPRHTLRWADNQVLDKEAHGEKGESGHFHERDLVILRYRDVVDVAVVIQPDVMTRRIVGLPGPRIKIRKPKIKVADPD